MHEETAVVFLLLQCTLCLTIRVPVDWNHDSEVKEQFDNTQQAPIYNEYFQYTAKKPQFAIDIAATHGVPSPENHYKSYPIKPHTGVSKPVLGQHQIASSDNNAYAPYQQFVQKSANYVTPVKTSYEVFHPYTAEQPALQALYKDPVLDKIRNDLRDSKQRLQKYENDAGESDVQKEEYLESPEETDRKKIPQKNVPVQYELHRPQRRPAYYRLPPRSNYREQVLNHRLRHPWNQNIAKVTPNHYRPVKNHLQRLRQQHALKYDDERNEYPQLPPHERYEKKPDGYDIYEKGKENYLKLRNNFDESINKVVLRNRPNEYQSLELQNGRNQDDSNETSDEEIFVPIKNYAQVRKTETTKHLPKIAAIRDAENYEEIQNAPRLREAIKSTKAQIVYSEEGYEDAAFDHAGEQKQASDHEGHGGYLKENEISGGKYKTPAVNSNFDDAEGSAYRDQLQHGKKWKDNKKENQEESETSDYSEDEHEDDSNGDVTIDDYEADTENDRKKRDSKVIEIDNLKEPSQHDVTKRETTFSIPKFDFNSTLPTDDEILKLSKIKSKAQKIRNNDNKDKNKYPYYLKNLKSLSKNSPLRYAENIKLIPKKSHGGTEFYDSRSKYECPEVDENVDAVPEKLKKDGHPDENEKESSDSTTQKDKFESLKNRQRLQGLGDKIDCFKAKYFGENPLDSPFFKEDLVDNPEPVTKPNLAIFKTKQSINKTNGGLSSKMTDIFDLIEKSYQKRKQNENNTIQKNVAKNDTLLASQSNVYKNVLSIINKVPQENNKDIQDTKKSNDTSHHSNTNYTSFLNKEDITKAPFTIRKKRATPFMYEPYKIIRDSQVQDSKKTTTTSNISPLIKQLQSSRVIDKVTANTDNNLKKNTKVYKDIGKIDRQQISNIHINDTNSFVDVNPENHRGEPRFELRPGNHKTSYSPVANKRAISVEEYKKHMNDNDASNKTQNLEPKASQTRSIILKTTSRPYFDVTKYLPPVIESQNIAASNAVRKVIRTSPDIKIEENEENKYSNIDKEQEYEDYEEEDEENEEDMNVISTTTSTTTTTTTKKPTRKRTRGTTSTIKPYVMKEEIEKPKLHLTTRFRIPSSTEKSKSREHFEVVEEPIDRKQSGESDTPKYSEKKRKSSKSTLITDTKSYGDEDDDDTRKEVDDLLHVKQNMDEYMPKYEKLRYTEANKNDDNNKEEKDEINDDKESNDDDDEDDENDDDNHFVVKDDDNEDNDNDKEDNSDDENIDKDEDDDNDDEENDDEDDSSTTYKNNKQIHFKVTTSEPTKRTLARTTIAPPTTTESRSARIELKPTILKKKIEIHEESPTDRSSPHVTQFKQNIKEVEIIKEMVPKPKRRKNKNSLEALHLYRDENLAEEINKLGDVEVFKENLDLESGPKHGGNYRSITPEELEREKELIKSQTRIENKGDVEASETANKKVEVETLSHQDSFNKRRKSTPNNNNRSEKYIELSDAVEAPRTMHGGNLKFSRNKGSRRDNKSEKLIEFDDDDDDDNSSTDGGNYRSSGHRNTGRPMHGGNYKSAKIIQADDTSEKPTRVRGRTRGPRTNAALTLDSLARAVPVLTTPPPFILDPSKRMYYYVEP